MNTKRIQVKLLATFTLLFFSGSLLAQFGSVKGVVTDKSTGETIIGATVSLSGTTVGTMTDIDGVYELGKVPVGKSTVKISSVGYSTLEIADVIVFSGQTTLLDVKLGTDDKMLEEVKVVAQRFTFSDLSVITEIKQAEGIAVGISAEQIGKTQDRDAAQVIRRVPGISIFDDRFVVVRGLNERYNTVMLNNAISPSTEVDTRAFSFDLIPSGAIDRMIVYKSPSADLPGDFSGGVIKIYTKTVPEGNKFQIGVQGGFRQGTTLMQTSDYRGSSTDFLGFDDGLRKLPSGFPSRNDIVNNPSSTANTAAFKSLGSFYDIVNKTISPDLRLNALLTRKAKVYNKDLTSYTSLSYSNTNNYFSGQPVIFKRYDNNVFEEKLPNDFSDLVYQNNVRVGVMTNWALILNPRNKIEFRNLFNQLANKETITRGGSTDNVYAIAGNSFTYSSRSIYTGQLSGKHDVGSKAEVEWNAGLGYTSRLEPDTRRFIQSQTHKDDNFIINVPTQSSPTLEQASRFFSNLKELSAMSSALYEYRFEKTEGESNPAKIKVGYYTELKSRDFSARWFGYVNPFRANTAVSPEEFFQTRNISGEGTYMNEGTNYDDEYTARNINASGYVLGTLPLNKLKITAGVRTEFNEQSLNSFRRGSGRPVNVNLTAVNVLPSVNTSFNFSEKSLVRASWGMTLNRPEFRELAPFTYYDFNLNASKTGNPELINATVNNFDLRYEWYPSEAELISIGVFHKLFKNPIEQVIRYSGSGVNFSYANVGNANSTGVELEMRKSLSSWTSARVLKDMNVMLNASLINSSVHSSAGAISNFGERQLQGQSPYIVNAGLFYNNRESGLQFNAIYNIIGQRIVYVGDRNKGNLNGLYPDQYEMPRNMLDLSVIKKVGDRLELKVGGQDILNNAFRIYQDTNLDGKIARKPVKGEDDVIQMFRRGGYYSIGINYSL